MVAFHKEFRVSPTIAGKSMFRNKIPETLRPGCLCNGMKTPDHDYQLHLGGTAKPCIQKTLDCRSDLRNLCGRARQRSDLDDEYFYRVAIIAIVDVNRGVAAFLSVHTAGRRTCRQGRSSEASMHDQCLYGRHSFRFSGAWLAASSQPLPHP